MSGKGLHPALEMVGLAREYGRKESYKESISQYENAKASVKAEISRCTDIEANKKWNMILKELMDEEASIHRIAAKDTEILDVLEKPPRQPSKKLPEAVVDSPPEWSRDDNSPKAVAIQAPERRPVVNPIKKKAAPPPKPSNPPKATNHKAGVPPRSHSNNAMAAPAKGHPPAKNPPAHQPISHKPAQQPAKPANQPAPAQPSHDDQPADPLTQQIIDMGMLERSPNVPWDAIAGFADVKQLLRRNLVILPMRPDIAKGLLAPWKSVLFYGPPGTGKTLLAKAVATECKRTFFNVGAASLTSKFHGESEKLITKLFELAEKNAPSTIFFDEVDSIASQRGTSNEGEPSRRMKAQLLTAMEGIDGASDKSGIFVLAATNNPWDLDEALLRRFQKRIYIPLPDLDARKAVLKMRLSDNTDETFDFDLWAQKLEGYSCADITNLCKDVAQYVFNSRISLMDTQQFLNLPQDQAKIIVKNDDFQRGISLRKSSVDPEKLARFQEWRMAKGAE